MKRTTFAYVVQLDLPGGPIKIGHTSRPRDRFMAFDVGTPCALRVVGMTIHGALREAQMLAATDSNKIKGEWRYPTDELGRLIASYFGNGEWFVPAPNHAAHFAASGVRERVARMFDGDLPYSVCPSSCSYHWAKRVLNAAALSDPLLGLDWSGYELASSAPSLTWERPEVPVERAA